MKKNKPTSRIRTKFAWLPTIVRDLNDDKDYFIWFVKYNSYERWLPVNTVHIDTVYRYTYKWVVLKKYVN